MTVQCETNTGKVDQFTRKIQLKGSLTEDEVQSILKIADRCPVHQTLERTNQIVTELV